MEQRFEVSPAGDRYRSLIELQAAIKPFVWTTASEEIITDGA